jgi:hypothetical protein
MGWLLFCWRPWRERCMCCWSEDHPLCTLSLFRHTLPGGQQMTGSHLMWTLVTSEESSSAEWLLSSQSCGISLR